MTTTYNEIQLDALKELGNIGSGNAATSLSTMLNTPVDLEVTKVGMSTLDNALQDYPRANEVSVIHGIIGNLQGFMWLSLEKDDCDFLASIIACGMQVDSLLVLPEVSNILFGSYLSALSNMFSMTWELEPPDFKDVRDYINTRKDMKIDREHMLFIRNNLKINNRDIGCLINMVLNDESIAKLLNVCGVA